MAISTRVAAVATLSLWPLRLRPGGAARLLRALRRRERHADPLPGRRQGQRGRPAPRLRPDRPHVEPDPAAARRASHRDRSRPTRRGRLGEARVRLRQEEHGGGHPRAGSFAGARARVGRRARHRSHGGLRLRRPVSQGDRKARADGCLPARHRALEGRLADARPVALPLLREDSARARRRARAHLLRALLERLRGRPEQVGLGGRSPPLRRRLCSTGWDALGLRVLPQLRAGRQGLRAARRHASRHARAGPDGREGLRDVPDRAGAPGGDEREGRRRPWLRPLADRRGSGQGDPRARRVPRRAQ